MPNNSDDSDVSKVTNAILAASQGQSSHVKLGAGLTFGTLAGVVVDRAIVNPASTFEWVMLHGMTGFSLIVNVAMIIFCVKLIADIRLLDSDYAKKVESLMREREGLMRERLADLPNLIKVTERANNLSESAVKAIEKNNKLLLNIDLTGEDRNPSIGEALS